MKNSKKILLFLCTIPIISILIFSMESIKMPKEIISTTNAPQAIGPYSQAVKTDNLMFISGQIPLNPKTMEVVDGGVDIQIKQVLLNLKAIIDEAGANLEQVVKINVYLDDLSNFQAVNKQMKFFFEEPYPARAAVEVSRLPKDVQIEMDAILFIDN